MSVYYKLSFLFFTLVSARENTKKRELEGRESKKGVQISFYFNFSDGPIIKPDGTRFDNGAGVREVGDIWPYVGGVCDAPYGRTVGFGNEICTRTSSDRFWFCEGSYEDLYDWRGSLAYMGTFDVLSGSGEYAIVGGAGDHANDRGYISDVYDRNTGFSRRTINFER